MTIHYFLQIFI